MKIQIIKIISLSSLVLLGLLGILNIWEIMNWGEFTAKIMITLSIIFVVSALIFEILRKNSN